MIETQALIDKFKYAIENKWGYIWGAAGSVWTQAKQNAATREQTVKYGQKWVGHYVADCSGMFSWAFKQLGGYMYHGSDTMFRKYTTARGELKAGKRTDGQELLPGTAVFVWKPKDQKYGHVGLYIGDGIVIEAASTSSGVIRSKVSASKWTHWGEMKDVNYGDHPEPGPEPAPPAGKAVVTGKNVALRQGPGTNTPVIIRIATGTTVSIAKVEGWTYVRYSGMTGFMMNEFIQSGEASVTVTGKNVALRAGTGTNTRVLTRIRTGTVVPRAQLPADWEYIEQSGRQGFMMKKFLREG